MGSRAHPRRPLDLVMEDGPVVVVLAAMGDDSLVRLEHVRADLGGKMALYRRNGYLVLAWRVVVLAPGIVPSQRYL